jgi:hypothetical protein
MKAVCRQKQNSLSRKIYRADEVIINREFPTEKLYESCMIRMGFFSLEERHYLYEMNDSDFLSGKTLTISSKDILIRLNFEIRGDFVKVFVLNKGLVCWICVNDNSLEALKPL